MVESYGDRLSMKGRTAIVAGGGLGMGFAIAAALAGAGARVAVVDIDGARAEAAARRIGSGSAAMTADVQDEAQVDRLISDVMDRWGGFDTLASVVGGAHGIAARVPLGDSAMDDWDKVVELNLRHFVLLARASANHFVARGVRGSMVSVSSVNGVGGSPNLASYGAAKAGLISLTRTLSVELGKHGIRVNSVAPGTIFTERSADAYTVETLSRLERVIPLGRLGRVEDVAGTALFLLSDLAAYVTGQTILVDGGIMNVYPFDLQPAE